MSELFDGLFIAGDTVPEEPTDKKAVTVPLQTGEEPMPERINLGRVYHKGPGTPYYFENSFRGIEYAAQHGYDAIDIDMQLGEEPTPTELPEAYGTHWERPLLREGFRDPLGKIKRTKMMQNMSDEQITRLRAGNGFRISTMAALFRRARELNIKVRAEAKPDDRWTVAQFRKLKRQADAAGAKVVIATQDTDPDWRKRLRRARKAGFDTRRLRG